MCFSATASYGAGAVLTIIGITSLKKSTEPSERLFASIPLLFAVQQFAEGILWGILPSANYDQLEKICVVVFIIIAQIVWPIWIPLSIHQMETHKLARQSLAFLIGIGVIVSLCMGWCLIIYGVEANIVGHHISYTQNYPDIFKGWVGYFYGLVTIFPSFMSSFKRMLLLGFAILVSYLVTMIYFHNHIISVWCFFAALISITVYYVLLGVKRKSVKLYANEIK